MSEQIKLDDEPECRGWFSLCVPSRRFKEEK